MSVCGHAKLRRAVALQTKIQPRSSTAVWTHIEVGKTVGEVDRSSVPPLPEPELEEGGGTTGRQQGGGGLECISATTSTSTSVASTSRSSHQPTLAAPAWSRTSLERVNVSASRWRAGTPRCSRALKRPTRAHAATTRCGCGSATGPRSMAAHAHGCRGRASADVAIPAARAASAGVGAAQHPTAGGRRARGGGGRTTEAPQRGAARRPLDVDDDERRVVVARRTCTRSG